MVEIKDRFIEITIPAQPKETYRIHFGTRMFPQIAQDLSANGYAGRYGLITDSNVAPLYAADLEQELRREGLRVDRFTFPAGEKNKTIETCMGIIGQMSDLRFGRDSAIIALGGGVVGDMTGFVAGIYHRGIPYVQVPTTVIAQADSSIGGKTSVDTKHGKNQVGVFNQPRAVYVDSATLETLPEDHYRAGLAETVKHAMIYDRSFFDFLEEEADMILERSNNESLYFAMTNCHTKGILIEQDVKEHGIRRILNYGHTIGHALESLSGYTMLHGEALSIGMTVEAKISQALGIMQGQDLRSQRELLERFGLPVIVPHEMGAQQIIQATRTDKKAKDEKPRYVLPRAIGEMHDFEGDYAAPVKEEVVARAIDETR